MAPGAKLDAFTQQWERNCAGAPGRGRRQSDSFLGENRGGYREIDVRAVLAR